MKKFFVRCAAYVLYAVVFLPLDIFRGFFLGLKKGRQDVFDNGQLLLFRNSNRGN